MTRSRRLGAAAALALAGPALAYVLPPAAVVKKVAEKRASLEVTSLEATGTVELRGAALARLGALAPAGGASLSLPARIAVKVPDIQTSLTALDTMKGRCTRLPRFRMGRA